MPADFPANFQNQEERKEQRATYCFIIHFEGQGRSYWTKYDQPVVLENLPQPLVPDGEGTKTFTPMQIGHGRIESSAEFNARSIPISVICTNELRAYFTTANATRINCYIIRVNTDQLTSGDPIDYENHCWVVGTGILDSIQIAGATLTAIIVPPQYYIDRQLSRYFFERQCNHVVYQNEPGTCQANPNDHMRDTYIEGFTRSLRELHINGDLDDNGADFAGGYLIHVFSGLRFSIIKETKDGGDTYLRLSSWGPEMEQLGDQVLVYKGCRHTLDDCRDIFDQEENYGGQPYIPNKNPSFHGV